MYNVRTDCLRNYDHQIKHIKILLPEIEAKNQVSVQNMVCTKSILAEIFVK